MPCLAVQYTSFCFAGKLQQLSFWCVRLAPCINFLPVGLQMLISGMPKGKDDGKSKSPSNGKKASPKASSKA